jgi:predicted nucleic acid-binding protein
LEQLAKLAEDKKLLIVTSTITIVETLRGENGPGDESKNKRLVAKYFEHPWIVLQALDRRTAELAAEIRFAHRLKTVDAIHVATALRWNVKHYHTYDEQQLKKNGLIGTPPLEIIKPRYPEDYPLFAGIEDGPSVLKMVAEDKETKPGSTGDADQVESERDQ